TVLFGDSSLDYGAEPGGRFDIGFWFDSACRFGLDGGFFLLSDRTVRFLASSDQNGSPVLSIPIFNAQTGREDEVPVSYPGTYAGSVYVTSVTEFGGANVDGRINLVRGPGLQVDAFAGFRFLDLRETLDISTPDVTVGNMVGQNGPTAYNTVDEF